MVGVKGKYKGCHTCRRRRVKCDNNRPSCKRCTDGGRDCEGYERETVFIVGTVDDRGRCTSHPPRNRAGPSFPASPSSPVLSRGQGAKKKTAKLRDNVSPSPGSGTLLPAPRSLLTANLAETSVPPLARDLAPVEPLAPAWDDGITLGSPLGGLHQIWFLAVRTQLGAVATSTDGHAPRNESILTLPPSCRGSEAPRFDAQEPFRMAAKCFLRLPSQSTEARAGGGHPGNSAMAEGSCLFLYEVSDWHGSPRDDHLQLFDGAPAGHPGDGIPQCDGGKIKAPAHTTMQQNFSAMFSNTPPWKANMVPKDDILGLGPAFFQAFPAHHFFVRVYRPIAVLTTLLTRTPSPFSAHEWTTVPYERYPRTPLDALLDTLALVPGLLARADRLELASPASPVAAVARRLKALDLLANCAAVEAQLAAWYEALECAAAENRAMPLLYWIAGSLDLTFAGGTWQTRATREGGPPDAAAQIPFADTYEFASTVVGLGHVLYWTGLMVLYECMNRLVEVVLGCGDNDNAMPGPALQMGGGDAAAASYRPLDLPPSCDPARYQARERRKLAANICRSLDWVIGSPSPDASLFVASPLPSSLSISPHPPAPPFSSVSPPSSSSSSSSWVPPPPSVSGPGPLPGSSPQPDPATTRGDLGPGDPEPRAHLGGHHAARQPRHRNGGVGHPDMASIPLWVVERFYHSLGDGGELELAWCRGFRSRLASRGHAVEGGVGVGWQEVARFGRAGEGQGEAGAYGGR